MLDLNETGMPAQGNRRYKRLFAKHSPPRDRGGPEGKFLYELAIFSVDGRYDLQCLVVSCFSVAMAPD